MKIWKISKSEQIATIKLYRGLSKGRANNLNVGDYLPVTLRSGGNQLTKNIETARVYASSFNDVEDGVVLELELDINCVKEDPIFKGDFMIINPCRIYGIKYV